MPKVQMIFDIPEESEEFNLALRGAGLAGAMDDFDHYLRNKLKHENLSDEEYHLYEGVRKEFNRLRGEANE